jgi:hypothetical protein
VGSGSRGSRGRRIIGRTNRDSSIGRYGDTGSGCRRRDRSSVGVVDVSKFKQRRVVGRQRRVEPHVVVHLNLERFQEGVWKRSMGMVEVSEVGSVNRCAWENSRWQRRESLRRVFEQGTSRMAVTANQISTKTSRFDNFIRTTFAISELSNCSRSGIAVDLNTSHDKITNSESNDITGFVGAFTVDGTAFFSK